MEQNTPPKSVKDFMKLLSGLESFFTLFSLFLEDNKDFLQMLEQATSVETDWMVLKPLDESYTQQYPEVWDLQQQYGFSLNFVFRLHVSLCGFFLETVEDLLQNRQTPENDVDEIPVAPLGSTMQIPITQIPILDDFPIRTTPFLLISDNAANMSF